MRVSSIDEYLEEYGADEFIPTEFSQVVVVECDYPELDVAIRWCWTCFGPKDGQCLLGSEYPACPVVLATERPDVRLGPGGQQHLIKVYDEVAPHTHAGKWTIQWLGKTDYDHGFAAFSFQLEADKDKFVQYVPNVDWGENYPWVVGESS